MENYIPAVSAPMNQKAGKNPINFIRYARLTLAAVLLMATFTVGTPFILAAIGRLRPSEWAQLSNVGQAYGGIASVFGMLALAGVAGSLVLQSRETTISREQGVRSVHSDLMFKALDDPELFACWGSSIQGNFALDRQHAYVNMIFAFWISMYEAGIFDEEQVRYMSFDIFRAAPGRRYWSIAGPVRKQIAATERERKITEAIHEEYKRAIAAPIAQEPESAPPPSLKRDHQPTAGALVLGLAGGALLAGGLSAIVRRYKCRM